MKNYNLTNTNKIQEKNIVLYIQLSENFFILKTYLEGEQILSNAINVTHKNLMLYL